MFFLISLLRTEQLIIVMALIITSDREVLAQGLQGLTSNAENNTLIAEIGGESTNDIGRGSNSYKENIPKKALVRSLILPGWGQLYNAQGWRADRTVMKANGIVQPKL